MQTTLLEQNSRATETKKCPFCAELIQAEAIKCRYCGEFLDNVARPPSGGMFPRQGRPGGVAKWYHSNSTLLVAVLFLGPLALPLAWRNPRYKPLTKVLITVAVIVLTVGLTLLLGHLTGSYYRNLAQTLGIR